MDFGRSGTEFWTRWFEHGSGELNTPEFKTEIDAVVNELRETVLKDRRSMRSFCADFGGELGDNIGFQQYGYSIETEHYRYCLRCKPQVGDYDGYLWCYDKRIPEMRQAQEAKELQEINEEIRPFDIQKLPNESYRLSLSVSSGYGQAAFDSYAASKGEAPGAHSHGNASDWKEVFRYAFNDMPGGKALTFGSEAECFSCCSSDLELLKSRAVTMKSLCEDPNRFTELVCEALDYSAERGIVGQIGFESGEKIEYTDPDEYVRAVAEELPYHFTSGFYYETLTSDPKVRKAVDDVVYDLFGEENPHPLEDYEANTPTMQMGGL